MLRVHVLVGCAVLFLSACHAKESVNQTDSPQGGKDHGNGSTAPTPPSPAPPTSPAPQAELPSSSNKEYRNGVFGARIENAAVLTQNRSQDGSGSLEGNVALTLFNTGDAPISVIGLDGDPISVLLSNGVSMRVIAVNGLKNCNNSSLQACQIGQSSDFTQIDPHSAVAVTLSMIANYSTTEATAMSKITTATLSKRLDFVTGPGEGKPITLSITNFPISNNTNSQ